MSWQWWCPSPDAGSPESRTAPLAAPWWTSPRLAGCCWVEARPHLILKCTNTHRMKCFVFKAFVFFPVFWWPSASAALCVVSLEMSSSSCQVILLPLSFFFSVVWLPRPMVIFPALFAPLTIVLDSVLQDAHAVALLASKQVVKGRNNPSV